MATNYRYPFSLEVQLPSLIEIIKALKKAEAKDLEYRDIRPLMALLERLKFVDPRLPGHIRKRKSALMSVNWDIITDDANLEDDAFEVKKRLESAIKKAKKQFPTQKLFGKFCLGINWEAINNTWKPISFITPKPWDTEAISDYPFQIAYHTHDDYGINRKKLVESVNLSYLSDIDDEPHNPGGVMRSIIFWEWLLYSDIKDWRNFNRRAQGLAVATHSQFGSSATDNAATTAEKAVKQLGEVNWAAVPASIKFEFLKAVDAVAASTYPNFKKAIESDIAVAIRGTANTSDLSDKGAKAAVATLFEVEEAIAYNDRLEFEEMINKQLIVQDWQRNHSTGDTSEIPWRFAWIIKEAQDAERNMRIAETMLRNGIPLYKSEIAEKCGFNPAVDSDVITPKQTTGLF